MKWTAALATGLVWTLSAGEAAAGDDAYDDDAPERRPEEDLPEEQEDYEGKTESLESGGLEAPGSLEANGDDRSEIEKELDEAERKDAGRGLEFVWLNAELGFQAIGLTTFKNGGLVPEGASGSGAGFVYGGGLGVRLLYFTLGARFRRAALSLYTPWSLVGEVGLRVPLGRLEPYATVSAGYAGIAQFSYGQGIGGLDLRLGGGLDFYFSDSFSVGAAVGGDLLFLSGGGTSSMGGGMTTTVLIGLHF